MPTGTVYQMFPVPLMQFELGREITPEEMEYVLSHEKKSGPNLGNRTSSNHKIMDAEVMTEIRRFIDGCIHEYKEVVIRPDTGMHLHMTQSWLNFTSGGEYHHSHYHKNSIISGSFYFQADRNIDAIEFEREQQGSFQVASRNPGPYNGDAFRCAVNTGTLVLFPSHVRHYVKTLAKERNDTRISVGFNTFFKGVIGIEEQLTKLEV